MTKRLSITLLAAAALIAPASAHANPPDTTNLRHALKVSAIRDHQRALWQIAKQYGGTRASSTPGYTASVEYIVSQLPKGAYRITRQEFDFPYFEEVSPSEFAQTAPVPTTYEVDVDFTIMEYSGSAPGGVTGALVPVDVTLPPPAVPGSTSGCEAADFAGFPAGAVALIQRGTCSFFDKAQNAKTAGAVGVVIFNEGQPGRTELLSGTLGDASIDIPVIGTTFALGEALASGAPVTVRLRTETISETRTTENVIAETRAGRARNIVVVGAHLDSVPDGAGINDNGSGTATILEIARQMANLPVRNKVRFAFWGAEESGLFGSAHYVASLTPDQLARIGANLNFDMLGSPNFARLVYDGDGSDTPDAGPPGSAEIERIFLNYFKRIGLATEPTAFDGRSDYGPFIDAGIPAGGLFSGAEEIKTPEQVVKFGGTAGLALDPCYHQACDDVRNFSRRALDDLGDAAAHATLVLAQRRHPIATVATTAAAQKLGASSMEYKGHRLQK